LWYNTPAAAGLIQGSKPRQSRSCRIEQFEPKRLSERDAVVTAEQVPKNASPLGPIDAEDTLQDAACVAEGKMQSALRPLAAFPHWSPRYTQGVAESTPPFAVSGSARNESAKGRICPKCSSPFAKRTSMVIRG
jgi:hypothetical protein